MISEVFSNQVDSVWFCELWLCQEHHYHHHHQYLNWMLQVFLGAVAWKDLAACNTNASCTNWALYLEHNNRKIDKITI